eukprot:scaffold5125_cov156-Amphora_coffeaeformis.AAC.1
MASTTEKLERLASKQAVWSQLPPSDKLALLQTMRTRLKEFDGYYTAAEKCVQETMGIPLHTEEGDFQTSVQRLILITGFSNTLDHLIIAYKNFAGQSAKPELPIRKLSNGQFVVQVAPFTPDEKSGPFSKTIGEVYLDADKVKSKEDVKLFDFDLISQDGKGPGVAIVLGAGNFSLLPIGDCFSVMFRNNRCVLLKHHPLREYQHELLNFVMAPLVEAGYLDFQMDRDFDRQALYYDKVALVHMTGGKFTHDAIVWGPTAKEQSERRCKGTPLLKAKMASELGCVTPWIVPEAILGEDEMKIQAELIAKAVFQNCSFACNSPKVVILSHAWKQREEFIDIIVEWLKNHPNPPAYYPGAQERWKTFQEHASPRCREIRFDECNVERRELIKPLLQKEPVLLPWLINPIEVDLLTREGVEAISSEYAFRNEPFTPVLTICTIQSTTSPEDYLETAVNLCNNHIFGSLSVTLTVPESVKEEPYVETAIQKLEYGIIATNAWSVFAYNMKGLPWGAHPGERLDAVESGIGCVNQYCFIPHVVKGVVRFPKTGSPSMILPEETRANAALNRAFGNLILRPGLFTILNVLWCIFWSQLSGFLKAVKLL